LVVDLHRYMQELEESLNFSLGGVFLGLLISICFVAFSAVTVNVSFKHEARLSVSIQNLIFYT
jgi:hypothetical protein